MYMQKSTARPWLKGAWLVVIKSAGFVCMALIVLFLGAVSLAFYLIYCHMSKTLFFLQNGN